jgi:hypothetical protein
VAGEEGQGPEARRVLDEALDGLGGVLGLLALGRLAEERLGGNLGFFIHFFISFAVDDGAKPTPVNIEQSLILSRGTGGEEEFKNLHKNI